MPNLVTFEQLFHIFLGCIGMQVDYAKTDLIVTARNTRTRVHVYTTLFISFMIFNDLFRLLIVLFINTIVMRTCQVLGREDVIG